MTDWRHPDPTARVFSSQCALPTTSRPTRLDLGFLAYSFSSSSPPRRRCQHLEGPPGSEVETLGDTVPLGQFAILFRQLQGGHRNRDFGCRSIEWGSTASRPILEAPWPVTFEAEHHSYSSMLQTQAPMFPFSSDAVATFSVDAIRNQDDFKEPRAGKRHQPNST